MANSDWGSGGTGNGNGGGGVPRNRVVGHLLASSMNDYLLRVQELGAIEDGNGGRLLNPTLRPVINALHTVLAGGDVEITIKHSGHPDLVKELNRRAEDANREASEINKSAGFYVGIEV